MEGLCGQSGWGAGTVLQLFSPGVSSASYVSAKGVQRLTAVRQTPKSARITFTIKGWV